MASAARIPSVPSPVPWGPTTESSRCKRAPPLACGGGVAENFAAIQGGGGGVTGHGRGLAALFFDGWLGGCCTPAFLAGQRMGAAFTDVFAVADFWATCTGQVMSLTPEMGK